MCTLVNVMLYLYLPRVQPTLSPRGNPVHKAWTEGKKSPSVFARSK